MEQEVSIFENIFKATKCGPIKEPIIFGPYIPDEFLSENTKLLKKIYNCQSKYNKNRLYKNFMKRIFKDIYE